MYLVFKNKETEKVEYISPVPIFDKEKIQEYAILDKLPEYDWLTQKLDLLKITSRKKEGSVENEYKVIVKSLSEEELEQLNKDIEESNKLHSENNLPIKITEQTDTTRRVFSTRLAIGKTWAEYQAKANSILLIGIYIPCSTNRRNWDGGILEFEYNLNSTGWNSLGNAGYCLIEPYYNEIVFDPNSKENYKVQFRYKIRAIRRAVVVNENGIVGKDFFSKLIIKEVKK